MSIKKQLDIILKNSKPGTVIVAFPVDSSTKEEIMNLSISKDIATYLGSSLFPLSTSSAGKFLVYGLLEKFSYPFYESDFIKKCSLFDSLLIESF